MSYVSGVVQAVSSRATKTGKKVYSVMVNDKWYGGMFDDPKLEKGQAIEFAVAHANGFDNVEKGSIKRVEVAGTTATEAAIRGVAKPAKAEVNWEQKDARITYLASRKDALELVTAVLALPEEKEVITLPKAQAKRLAALTAIVDELALEFFTTAWHFDASKSSPAADEPEAE